MEARRPQVFLSFASQDEALVNALKSKLAAVTNHEIDFFLAADGVSIPAGTNWPAHLENTLQKADVIVVIMSYAAAASQWVFFEAGFAYAIGKPVIPVGVMGLIVERQPPPISLLQGLNISSANDLNALIRRLNHRLVRNDREEFTDADYDDLFAKQAPQIPLPRTQPLLSRPEIYRDILRQIKTLSINAEVRVTATMHDPMEYEDIEFTSYLLALAQKCGVAETACGRMEYHIIIGITREPNGSIPDALWRAISQRAHIFQDHGALNRLKLFEVTQRWSLNTLFFNRDYVVFGFPEDVTAPRLQHGFRMSGFEFVSPLVDWYDRVERNATPLPVEQFLRDRESHE
jgi:hypothetical protein